MGADNTLHISKWRARDKKISAKTKLKLRDKVRDFNAKLALDNIQAKNITVRTWLQRWLDVYVKTSCKQKT